MAKDSFYFQHDYDAAGDDKILELRASFGAEGYGVFWMMLETMAKNENGGIKKTLIGGLSLGYGVAKDRLLSIIDCCLSIGLFYEFEGFVHSKRLLEHKYIRKNLSDAGRRGAEIRWGGHSHPNSTPNGKTMPKERKGKEIKKGERFSEDKKSVVFGDGTIQPLGESQLMELGRGCLSPRSIVKGTIQ